MLTVRRVFPGVGPVACMTEVHCDCRQIGYIARTSKRGIAE